MFKRLIAEARELVESGPPGKLSRKWDRGSRGADSFRSFTKKATNRHRRRLEKKMLDDTPKTVTQGYQHASWPSNPVFSQGLAGKPNAFSSKKAKAESRVMVHEGGGSRSRKAMRQAAMMKHQGIEPTPARGYQDQDKKAMSRDMNASEPYGGDPLAQKLNSWPGNPHTKLKADLYLKRHPRIDHDPLSRLRARSEDVERLLDVLEGATKDQRDAGLKRAARAALQPGEKPGDFGVKSSREARKDIMSRMSGGRKPTAQDVNKHMARDIVRNATPWDALVNKKNRKK